MYYFHDFWGTGTCVTYQYLRGHVDFSEVESWLQAAFYNDNDNKGAALMRMEC